MTPELARSCINILGVFALFVGSTFGLSQWQRAGKLSPEIARKMLHVGLGLIALSFPYLFGVTWPIIFLAVAAMLHLWAMRRVPFMRNLCGRVLAARPQSAGEFCYIAAVLLVWIGARGNTLLYVAPLLTLALADAAGALVGMRWGRHSYDWGGGSKTREGSLAVFFVTVASVLASFSMFENARALEAIIALSLVTASLVVFVEAVTPLGADNLAIPLVSLAVLAAGENGFLHIAIAATCLCVPVIVAARWMARRADIISMKPITRKLSAARW